jgi:hypothetical protein
MCRDVIVFGVGYLADDSECAGSLSVVTTRRVVRAWQAVARMHELLTEESEAGVKNGEAASVEGA